jgi:DNA-binding NarL/FixJ family response regulator
VPGGVLVVSKAVNNHSRYKKRLAELGFVGADVTAAQHDGLSMQINDMKPRLVLMSCRFYESATPYMMNMLIKKFPYVNFAGVSLEKFPYDLAMAMILNGAKGYVNYFDGREQFYGGLEKIKNGDEYVPDCVQERMDKRAVLPRAASELTERQIEVLRFLCNGFTSNEIVEMIGVSKRTVEHHKKELYTNFMVRNENELIRIALFLGIIRVDELNFYGGSFELSPKLPKPKTITFKRGK